MSKKLILIIASSLGSVIGFGLLFTVIVSGGFDNRQQLDLAMRLLDEGRWDVAGRIARDLDEAGRIDAQTDSAWNYVQGVAKFRSVEEQLDSPLNRRVLLEATEHLSKANKLSFPLGYQGKGKHYLAACYLNTYRWADVVATLQGNELLWPERRSDAFQMLVDAFLQLQPPQHNSADSAIDKWQNIPGMGESELSRISISLARVDYSLDNFDACQQHLAEVGKFSPEYATALLWQGRWRQKAVAELPTGNGFRAQRLGEAEQVLRTAFLSPKTPPDLRRQALFLFGRNQRLQGKLTEALGTFSGVRTSSPQSSEALAAGIEEAEILLELDNLDEVLATCNLVLNNIEDLKLYNGYWLPVDQLRARILEIGRQMRERQEFTKAIRLAKLLDLAFPLSDSIRMQAEAYEQWGDSLVESPVANTYELQNQHRENIKARYEEAAENFEQLAELELRSEEFPEILWRSVENFRKAQQLEDANRLLKEYLKYETPSKRPRGFLALGDNLMNMAEWSGAVQPLERCLREYPGHPTQYEARLLAAKAYQELDNLGKSIELLEENLFDHNLAPDSLVWRDCMLQLGHTLFRRGNRLLLETKSVVTGTPTKELEKQLEESQQQFIAAIERFALAVPRFENDPQHYDARYMLAKSYRLAADTVEELSQLNKTFVDSARRQLLQQRRGLLEQSLLEFQSLQREISQKQDIVDPMNQHAALVRNCYFGEADTLFELQRWDEAIRAYRNAASRYMNQPEALEAFVQMSICHRKLGDEDEATRTLNQAEQILKRIPSEYDPQFAVLTRADRAGWQELIGWLKQWN